MTTYVTLGEVAKIDRRPASEIECRSLPYVGLEAIEKEVGGFSDDYKRTVEPALATNYRFTPEHILYGKLRPYLNKVALPDFHGVCSTEILPILPRPDCLNKGYFYSMLLSSPFVTWASANVSGANLPRLDPGRLAEYSFPLPSVQTQEAIATSLSRVNRLRRTRRYAQQLSDTFLQSVFLEMFGDPAKNDSGFDACSFGDVVASTKLGLVRGASEMSPQYAYPYVRMDAIIGDGNLNLHGLRRVEATRKEVQEYSLSRGDFLFNTRNSRELVGKTALFVVDGTYLFNNNVMRVRFGSNVQPEYMMGLFQTQWAKNNLETIKSGTTSVFAIYYKDLIDLPIILPPAPQQEKYALVVRQVERLRAQQREATRQAEHLFQTLLHQAFRGDL